MDDPDSTHLDAGFDPRPGPAWTERLNEWRHRAGLDGRAVGWVLVALIAALVAAWLLRPSPTPLEETIPTAASSVANGSASEGSATAAPGSAGSDGSSGSAGSTPSRLVAHAAGAVVRPGIYTLEPDARVDDLIRAAGGAAPDADLARVNLAAPLTDGARLYVPRVGEQEPPVVGPDGGSPPVGSGGEESSSPVNINSADVDELDELPGVGPSIAASIVAYRTENGGFTSVDELLEVRGIGEAKLAEIRDLVTL